MRARFGAYEIAKRGATRYDFRDPFHVAVSAPWRLFLLLIVGLWIAINLAFATLYVAVPGSVANARPGSFSDAFFFSIETLATVGYGVMAPATLYGHAVSALEIFCGMGYTALATGLILVRFSRPRGKFLFAGKAVVSTLNGRPTLMVRIANGRLGPLTGARAALNILVEETTQEGLSFRRGYDLQLVRTTMPVFGLTWTLMHEIGPESPLYGMSAAELAEAETRLILSVIAYDPALAADVRGAHDYAASDILFGMRYADAVITDENGEVLADLNLLSDVEPEGAARPSAAETPAETEPALRPDEEGTPSIAI
jgi:inward rectifier potassium channel